MKLRKLLKLNNYESTRKSAFFSELFIDKILIINYFFVKVKIVIEEFVMKEDLNLLENNNDFKEIINRKGSNAGKLIVVIIFFLLMIGLGVGGYIFYKFNNSPKVLFVKTLSKYTLLKNDSNDLINFLSKLKDGYTFSINNNVKIKSDKEEIMNALVNIKLTNNFEKKLANLDINFDDNNGSVINFNSLMEENRTYLKLNDIFDKYYYLDEDNSSLFEDSEIVDDSKLIEVVSNSFSSYFTDDKFSKENVDDNVKITVGLNDKDFYDLINLIVNDLKNSKVLEVYASKEFPIEDIYNGLDDFLSELKNELNLESKDITYSYSIYEKNNKLIKQELSIRDILVAIEGDTKGNIYVYNEGKIVLTGNYNKNYFKLSYEEDGVNLNLSIDYKNNSSASEFDSNYNIVLRINELTISDYVKLNINDNKEILEIDKENSKKIDDITAEEEEQIYNKLFEIPLISSYMNMYDNLINSNDLNYDLSTEM